MFGQIGQIAKLLGNTGKIKAGVAQLHERLKAARFVGQAGGSQVTATCDGRGELVSIRLDPTLMKSGDVELLEDLIVAAVSDGIRQSRDGAKKEMESLANEMGVPGIGGMLESM